jgi:hypothetical protein
MELSGTQFVPAPQERVWAALNDPDILKACIPGCESIQALSAGEYEIVLSAKVGPVAARFKGKLNIADAKPPVSYSLTFEGQGGVAGFAKGGAQVSLAPVNSGTELSYSANARVGGKLAQIGSRLIDLVATKTANDFFAAFVAKIGVPGTNIEPAPDRTGNLRRLLPWLIAAAVLALIAYFFAAS